MWPIVVWVGKALFICHVWCVYGSACCRGGGGLVSKSCPTLWTPWTAARQASLSFTISWTLLNLMSIESVMLSNHLILCHPLLLLPSIFPSIRVFSSESALRIKWPKYWGFGFSVSPSSEVNDACVYISIYVCSYTPVQARRHWFCQFFKHEILVISVIMRWARNHVYINVLVSVCIWITHTFNAELVKKSISIIKCHFAGRSAY